METQAVLPQTSLSELPNELLSHILGFLDSRPLSESRLHDVTPPYGKHGRVDSAALKSCSLVNRRWRAAVLPLLFRHVQWPVAREVLLGLEDDGDPVASIPTLDFIRSHNLQYHVRTFSMLVEDNVASNAGFRDAAESPQGQTHGSGSDSTEWTTYNQDYNWFWDAVFELVNPLRFTIVTTPQMLALLFARSIYVGDSWSFGPQLHVLSLSRESRRAKAGSSGEYTALSSGSTNPTPEPASGPYPTTSPKTTLKHIPCTLFTARPWTKLLLNEGPSVRVYSSYEFFLKRPPSILGALLGCERYPNDQPLIPPSVSDLSYVAAFPLSTHVGTLVRNLPVLERLFVQLVPREGRHDVLGDPVLMRNVDPSDLWTERNSAYQLFIGAILRGLWSENWNSLRVFESGDSADQEAWELASQYVEMSGSDWRVAGEGIFVKGREEEDEDEDGGEADQEEEEDDDEDQDPYGDDEEDEVGSFANSPFMSVFSSSLLHSTHGS
ncbi:uncharacterized protein PpBr36_10673 [Pyricularia pennisetigena]|uniref:uncharacterized protein n=1 Tax=Pyricularia pennisetigena TaxID=1578925 RepID=UPI00114F8F8C|nr:uncharacterized protein PpBr36_10673 [Pyricularia pennisetigena]TLS20945.1 hypothetical protein PpBr36_10673 [Pyricularia pennisetigena]